MNTNLKFELHKRILSKYNKAISLEFPQIELDGKEIIPHLMQRVTVVELLNNKTIGNWSDMGTGKTLNVCCSEIYFMNFKNFIENLNMDEGTFFTSLMDDAKNNNKWGILSKREGQDFWENDGDLVDKWQVKSPRDLHKTKVNIPVEHVAGLKNFDSIILELYNSFDIWLKDKYNVNVVDFIDYDIGEVWLIKSRKFKL